MEITMPQVRPGNSAYHPEIWVYYRLRGDERVPR
jgi:hypothetical protein